MPSSFLATPVENPVLRTPPTTAVSAGAVDVNALLELVVRGLRNSRAELRRVTWPSRNEVVQSTQATLIFVLMTVAFLLLTDTVLGNAIRVVL